VKSFAGDINYNDVLAEGSGYQKGLDILNVYNPIGGEKQYVPTTIFVTLIKDTDGSVKVAWHSVLDAISEEEINAYAKDAIYYYKQNAAGWQ
jgi:hypothetical protein